MKSNTASKIADPNDAVTDFSGKGQTGFNRRILIVEDETNVADVYKQILTGANQLNVVPLRKSSRQQSTPSTTVTRENFDVVIAYTADSALRLVREHLSRGEPFAMGFFDVLLGNGMDGIELVREIFRIDPDLHAVIVTAYSDRSVNSIGELLGVEHANRWDYLNKPFSEGEIVQKARNATALWNLRNEKRKNEEHLAEVNRKLGLSERAHTVATVARGVAHEFGNLLVQIVGRAELSRDGSADEMRSALDTILKATETATEILERFKSLSQPAERLQQMRKMDVREPLETALQLIDHQLRVQSVKVCKIKWDEAWIEGSPTALTQVFLNLFMNAMQAMHGSGQLDISVVIEGESARIVIRDYGPGIPADFLSKVFDSFFTTKKTGTGLGLAICKEIIEIEHGGRISAANHGAQGAEFTIKLPLMKGFDP